MHRPRQDGKRFVFRWLLVLTLSLVGSIAAQEFAATVEIASRDDSLAAAEAAKKREDWEGAVKLYEQALEMDARSPESELRRLEAIEALANLYYVRMRDSRKALPYFEQAAEIRRRSGLTADRQAGMTWSDLGSIYQSLHAYGKALELAHEELQRDEVEKGSDSPSLAGSLVNLGWLMEQVRPADPEIETVLLRAVELSERGRPVNRRTALAAMARYYLKHGHVQVAESYFTVAIRAHGLAKNPKYSEVASLYRELGKTQSSAGRLEAAESSFRAALALDERRLGETNPHLLHSLHGLGKVLTSLERFDEARSYLVRTIEVAEAAWGPSVASSVRYDLAVVERQLGGISSDSASGAVESAASGAGGCCCANPLSAEIEALRSQGDIEGAIALARSELAARVDGEGPDSLAVAEALEQLGILLWSMDAAAAAEVYEKRFHVLRGVPATSNQELGRIASSLGYLYSTVKRYEEAERWHLESVERYSVSAPGTARIAEALEDLAQTRMHLGEAAEAAEDFELSAALWQQLVGDDAPQTRGSQRYLAEALVRAERFDEAEQILLRQLAALERDTASAESWLLLERVFGALNRLYKASGHDREALEAEWRRNELYQQRDD